MFGIGKRFNKNMSINNMKNRINYQGGATQLERMNKDKLKSLEKALLYSYQAATAILPGGREFKCLINPNRLNLDLDNKIISIPFKAICLNGTEFEKEPVETGIKEGDVITWKENDSHWLVYLRRLEETAYFRADLRRCRHQITLENGSKYWGYVRGPIEQSVVWNQVNGNYFNKPNSTLVIYISQNEETLNYFYRFKKVLINDKPWEVQAMDSISTPGIIELTLKETYSNTVADDIEKAVEQATEESKIEEKEGVYIFGRDIIYPYESHEYILKNHPGGGRWMIKNESRSKLVKIESQSDNSIKLNVITGKSGFFTLAYLKNNIEIAFIQISIGSL